MGSKSNSSRHSCSIVKFSQDRPLLLGCALLALTWAIGLQAAWAFASKTVSSEPGNNSGVHTEPLHPSLETVWIFRPDGAQSCDPQSGISLSQGVNELKAANIPILESRKGNDGKFRAQVCGMPKGTNNSFRIPRKNLQDAVALGYQELDPQ